MQKFVLQIGLKKFFSLKKLKILCHGPINDLNWEEIVGTFYEKEFIIRKVMKRKGDKLYVKWKGYNDLFNSWIDKKDIVWMRQYFPELES